MNCKITHKDLVEACGEQESNIKDLFSKLVLEDTSTYTKRLYNYKVANRLYTSKTQMITETKNSISSYLNSLDFSKVCYIEKNGWKKYLPFDSTDEEKKFAFVHPYTGVEERFDTKNKLDDRINILKNIFKNEYTQNLNKNMKEEVSIQLNEEISIKAWIPYNA